MATDTRDYLSAAQAVAELGITRATLYAYVSRGWLRSVPGKGRRRLYAADDVEKLKARSRARSGHGPVAGSALRWGDPVITSEITEITPAGPRYRGHLATDLSSQGKSFEQVATLLWNGTLAVDNPWQAHPLGLALRRLDDGMRPGADPLECIQFGLATIAAKIQPLGLAGAAEQAFASQLIARLAAVCGLVVDCERVRDAAQQTGVAATLAYALGGAKLPRTRAVVAAIDAALVLCADHELNTSTFTARVVASTGADLCGCLVAALAALSGPQHGGACRRIEGLMAEASRLPQPADVVAARLGRGEQIPGFGHPFYPSGDPRGRALMTLAQQLAPARARPFQEIADAMNASGRPLPALDFGLVALASCLQLVPGAATVLFAIGRTAGWVAHITEQRRQGFLLRPRARYTGKPGPQVVPSEVAASTSPT